MYKQPYRLECETVSTYILVILPIAALISIHVGRGSRSHMRGHGLFVVRNVARLHVGWMHVVVVLSLVAVTIVTIAVMMRLGTWCIWVCRITTLHKKKITLLNFKSTQHNFNTYSWSIVSNRQCFGGSLFSIFSLWFCVDGTELDRCCRWKEGVNRLQAKNSWWNIQHLPASAEGSLGNWTDAFLLGLAAAGADWGLVFNVDCTH